MIYRLNFKKPEKNYLFGIPSQVSSRYALDGNISTSKTEPSVE